MEAIDKFIIAVAAMRASQKKYFTTRSPEALRHAKFFEAKVDAYLATLHKGEEPPQLMMF